MKAKTRKSRFLLALITVFLTASLFLIGCNGTLTKSNYDKIQNGMSSSEVIEILGDDYEAGSSAGFGDYSSEVYVWGNSTKNITIIFLNGEVFSKAQVGLTK